MIKASTHRDISSEPLDVATKAPDKAANLDLPPQESLLRRIGKHPVLMHYNRLIALVVLANLAFLGFAATSNPGGLSSVLDLSTLSNLVLAHFALAILIRQQYVINLLFWLATRAPTSWPLSIRWILGKVYHFGGLHVGGAVVGTVWLAFLVRALVFHVTNGLPGVSIGTVTLTYALLLVLILMVIMALPPIRAHFHNRFEVTHRFGGWTALLLWWAQSVMFINDQRGVLPLGDAVLASPSFWVLGIVTVSIILPWLRLRKVSVRIEKPSSHVVLARFNHGVTPFAGSSTTISRNPLIEWHSFANVPAPGEDGFRLTISRAGDWTGALINDVPEKVWVKGIPTAGVGNIDMLFKRVVWVATGSGIGPTLPHLLAKTAPAHLVWSTRSPRKTYGDALVDEILTAEPNALIWDTDTHGRPDLVKLAYEAYKSFDAEAVIVIANKKLTWQVVYGMESRGIPAYGAIWDS
ncbi:MAG: hypothetical protein MI924_26175 [Chloroflexales bacterium]|nr:hypothetical protein [Chloroflexales bacterium]